MPGEGRGLVGGKGRGGRRAPLQESSSIKEQERAPVVESESGLKMMTGEDDKTDKREKT